MRKIQNYWNHIPRKQPTLKGSHSRNNDSQRYQVPIPGMCNVSLCGKSFANVVKDLGMGESVR